MFRMSLVFSAFSLSLALAANVNPDPKSLEIPGESHKKAKELLKKLGSKDYAEREDATRALTEMGRLALPTIKDALQNETNAEIHMRCELLHGPLQADDIRARLACFLADKEGKFKHELPGATEFFKAAGTSDAARNLYRELAESPDNRNILFALGGDKENLGKIIVERRNLFANRVVGGVIQPPHQATMHDIAMLLVAESFCPDKAGVRNTGINSMGYLMSTNSTFNSAIDNEKTKEPLLSIIGHWVDNRTDAYSIYYAMNNGLNNKRPYAITCAKRLLDPKLNAPSSYKGMAIAGIARLSKDDEHLAMLEPYLNDESVATNVFLGNNKRSVIQMRDIAIAMSLLMMKQDPTSFGLKNRYAGNNNDSLKYNYIAWYFDDGDGKADDLRKEAFKKFEEFKKASKEKKK